MALAESIYHKTANSICTNTPRFIMSSHSLFLFFYKDLNHMKTPNRPAKRPGGVDASQLPRAPFLKDRVQLSEDALLARAMRESAIDVHNRNPHTTYLSQIDSMVEMINTVAAAQAKAATPIVEEPPQEAPVARPVAKPQTKPLSSKMQKSIPRRPSITSSRALPSGSILIK